MNLTRKQDQITTDVKELLCNRHAILCFNHRLAIVRPKFSCASSEKYTLDPFNLTVSALRSGLHRVFHYLKGANMFSSKGTVNVIGNKELHFRLLKIIYNIYLLLLEV